MGCAPEVHLGSAVDVAHLAGEQSGEAPQCGRPLRRRSGVDAEGGELVQEAKRGQPHHTGRDNMGLPVGLAGSRLARWAYQGRSVNQGLRDDVIIRTSDQRLRVFVSSTLGELAEERRAVERAISTLRLTPVMFEAGARPHPPRALYRAYLAQSDIFVGLYWQRYGQLNPGMRVSGLEEEFDLARGQGLPRLLYVKAPAPDREPRRARLLTRIREEAFYRRFRTPAELGRLVRDDLAALLSERFIAIRFQTAAGPSPSRGRCPLPVATTSLVGREQA